MRQLRWPVAWPVATVLAAALAVTAGAATMAAAGTAAASSVPTRHTVVPRHPAPPLTAAAGRSQPSEVPGALRSIYSNIWAGHLVPNSLYGGKKITAVAASWTQPKVPADSRFPCHARACNGPDASEWTGFDGRGPGLIQAGCDSVSTAKPDYFCWWEDFPGPTHVVPLTVKPGQTVSVSIQYLGHDNTKFFIQTGSGHWGPKNEKTPSVGQTTALFMVERLMNGKQATGFYLPNFGSARFRADSFFQGSLASELTSGKNFPYVMVDGCSSKDKLLASAGNVNKLGQFTVGWKASRPFSDKPCK